MEGIEAARIRALAVLAERAPALAPALAALPADIVATAPAVLAASGFLLDALCRDDELITVLASRAAERFAGAPIALPALPQPPAPAAVAGVPGADGDRDGAVPGVEAQFMAALRRWRRAEFARIAWRDLAGWAALPETLADLSRAAELALVLAHEFALRALTARYGQPLSPSQVLTLMPNCPGSTRAKAGI